MNDLSSPLDAPSVLNRVNRVLEEAFLTRQEPLGEFSYPLRVGVDLGTASVVLAVVDAVGSAVSWEMEEASVVRDGLVTDFAGATGIVRRLKGILEERLGTKLEAAAVAVPPGYLLQGLRGPSLRGGGSGF